MNAQLFIGVHRHPEAASVVIEELIGGRQQMRTKSIKNCADPVWESS